MGENVDMDKEKLVCNNIGMFIYNCDYSYNMGRVKQMIIVGENLKDLIKQYQIVDKDNCYDETCISLRMGNSIIELSNKKVKTLTYGEEIPTGCIKERKIGVDGIMIPPMGTVLACSNEYIKMPAGYFGLIQTKGSLARLFVFVHCSDGQVDPGYSGSLTFELFNASPFNIRIRRLEKVANLYIFKTSCKNIKSYSGKYGGFEKPTYAKASEE